MRLSVAMCTCNGERHLPQQLDSIRRQTRLPDELIVCDDASADETIGVLEQFAASVPFPVRIYRNEGRMGATANFAKAISLCDGDVISLSDQDDIWLENRLSMTASAFMRVPAPTMFFSNARMVDDAARPLRFTLWNNLRFGPTDQRRLEKEAGFETLLRRNIVTGATMAFRAELRKFLLPIPELWIHDAWIALLCCFLGDIALCRSPLIFYREHHRQQLGAKRQSLKAGFQKAQSRPSSFYIKEAERFALLRQRIESNLAAVPGHVKKMEHLSRKLDFCNERLYCSERGCRSIFRIFCNFVGMRYDRYANGWRGAGADLAVTLGRRG